MVCLSIRHDPGRILANTTPAVVVEKPFTPTSQEAQELIVLAKKKNRLLTVYQNRRWDSDFLTLSKYIKNGSLGRVVEFETHFDRYRPDPPKGSWKLAQPAELSFTIWGRTLWTRSFICTVYPEELQESC